MGDNGADNGGVPACFFFADSVSRTISGFNVCKACEEVTGPGGIKGGQKLFGLWRIYCSTSEARKKLIMKGVTIDKQFVSVIGTNPFIVKDSERPSVKLIIGNIPLSVSNEEIEKGLRQVEGVDIRSKLYEECYRDELGKLSLYKTGRRFVYISAPVDPLPKEFVVGKWRPSLYHFGQKAQGEGGTVSERKNIAQAEPVLSGETAARSVGDTVADSQDVASGGEGSAPSQDLVQTNLSVFLTDRSRSKAKSPRSQLRSHSESITRRHKRSSSRGPNRVPNLKARKKEEGASTSAVDYFDFTNSQIDSPYVSDETGE